MVMSTTAAMAATRSRTFIEALQVRGNEWAPAIVVRIATGVRARNDPHHCGQPNRAGHHPRLRDGMSHARHGSRLLRARIDRRGVSVIGAWCR